MAAFRKFSDKYPFRMRSETPEIAIELSLQPWRAFRPDGVIFFSDILTPLPALGIEFDMVKGKGPVIGSAIRSMEQVKALRPLTDPSTSLPFINTILSTLRRELEGSGATLLGFIGTPWTLAAYAMEGAADKDCKQTKTIMLHSPQLLHALLDHLTQALIVYAGYQIESGAQVIQLFDSWAHHLSPGQFAAFSAPYAERVVAGIKAKYPHVPVILHANGGGGKLEQLRVSSADVIGLDWSVDMAQARATLNSSGHGRHSIGSSSSSSGSSIGVSSSSGSSDSAAAAACGQRVVQGNVDPMELFGPEEVLVESVNSVLRAAGPRGHILNVGHGVMQGTPESSVALFCEVARRSGELFKQQSDNAPA